MDDYKQLKKFLIEQEKLNKSNFLSGKQIIKYELYLPFSKEYANFKFIDTPGIAYLNTIELNAEKINHLNYHLIWIRDITGKENKGND